MAVFSTAYTRHCIGSAFGDHSVFRVVAAATTNANLVKGSAGSVNGLILTNGAGTSRYFRFFDLAVAPTPGTSTPLFTIILPASVAPLVMNFDIGIPFQNGISFDITGGVSDTDTTAISANDVHGSIIFS
jgi:hypothetical protein